MKGFVTTEPENKDSSSPTDLEKKSTTSLGAQARPNILSFIEFVGITLLLCYFSWSLLSELKLNIIEGVITAYLLWEFIKRVRQYLAKGKR